VTPFIDARFNIKDSADHPRWLRAFVASYQMIDRKPVARKIALVTVPMLFIMGADDHNAPGRANAPEALRSSMGHDAEFALAFDHCRTRKRWPRRGDRRGHLTAASGRDYRVGRILPAVITSPVAEAAAAERARMPAGRTIVHRTASAIGTAMPARTAATGDQNHLSRCGRIGDGRQRHRLRGGHADQAEAQRKGRCCE
jgi:hypothetical protein